LNCGAAWNCCRPRSKRPPQIILIERIVTVQCNRNKEIVFVVANEVYHRHIRLARSLPQAAPQLLHKNNCRLRRPQHHNLIHARNINTLVEDVNADDVLKRIRVALKRFYHVLTFLIAVAAGKTLGMEAVIIEHAGKFLRFLHPAAKNQTFHRVRKIAVELHRLFNMTHPLTAHELCEVSLVVNNFAVHRQVRKPVVMERTEQIFFKRLLQPYLVRNIIIEQRKNVEAVSTFRSCRKPQQELRRKVVDYFFVRVGTRMMHFVNDDVVK